MKILFKGSQGDTFRKAERERERRTDIQTDEQIDRYDEANRLHLKPSHHETAESPNRKLSKFERVFC